MKLMWLNAGRHPHGPFKDAAEAVPPSRQLQFQRHSSSWQWQQQQQQEQQQQQQQQQTLTCCAWISCRRLFGDYSCS
jgi:hypothetical protein